MPYVPSRTPVLVNMGESTIVLKFGRNVIVKLVAGESVNLDLFRSIDRTYVNSIVRRYERTGMIRFVSHDEAVSIRKSVSKRAEPSTKFINTLNKLLKDDASEQGDMPVLKKRRGRKPKREDMETVET